MSEHNIFYESMFDELTIVIFVRNWGCFEPKLRIRTADVFLRVSFAERYSGPDADENDLGHTWFGIKTANQLST